MIMRKHGQCEVLSLGELPLLCGFHTVCVPWVVVDLHLLSVSRCVDGHVRLPSLLPGRGSGRAERPFVDQFGFDVVTCCGYLPQVGGPWFPPHRSSCCWELCTPFSLWACEAQKCLSYVH